MDDQTSQTQGEVYFRKRFKVTFEVDAAYSEVNTHPDDVQAFSLLRDHLLADEDALAKLLLCRCLEDLEQNLPESLANAGMDDSSAREIVESKARLLPREPLEHLLYLRQAGLGFADELSGDAARCQISKVSFLDMERGKEIQLDAKPEPLFYHEEGQFLLAKAESEWLALLQVSLNFTKDRENRESIAKALQNIDEIYEQVSTSDLPLKEVSIGIVAAEEAEYEAARAQIEAYAKERLPEVKREFWFRKEKNSVVTFKELMQKLKAQGET